MNKYFLYGERKTGKSTIVDKLVDILGVAPSGFKTVSDSPGFMGNWNLYLVGASKKSIRPSEYDRVACCRADGSWESYGDVFDGVGVGLLTFSSRPQIVVMDEIGFMEKDALRFQNKVLEILDEPYPVIGVIKPAANPFMQKIYDHPSIKTMEITFENRDKALEELAGIFLTDVTGAAHE